MRPERLPTLCEGAPTGCLFRSLAADTALLELFEDGLEGSVGVEGWLGFPGLLLALELLRLLALAEPVGPRGRRCRRLLVVLPLAAALPLGEGLLDG